MKNKMNLPRLRKLQQTSVIGIGVAGCLFVSVAAGADKLTLVNKKIHPHVIIAPNATASEQHAAQELTAYLGKMTGRPIETIVSAQSGQPTAAAPVIILGHHPANLDLKPEKLDIEESIISVEPNRVRIVGGKLPPVPYQEKDQQKLYPRDRGTLYGVYNFLDDLGVRWYRPDPWGEHVPRKSKIVLPLGKTNDKPTYTYRNGIQIYRWWPDQTDDQRNWIATWRVRNRLNVAGSTGWDGGKYNIVSSHSHLLYVPPWKYFKEHPEYFALVNGKRTNKGQLCLGNPDVQRIVTEEVIKRAREMPHIDYFSLTPTDGGGYCECNLCRAMDDPNILAANGQDERLGNVSMSNRVHGFNNMVAKELAEAVPGKGVAWLAYTHYTEVPTNIEKFEPNTIIIPSTIAAAYSDYSKLLDDSKATGNVNFKEILEGFHKKGATLGTYEYWLGGYWYGPLPLLTIMKDRLMQYRKYNVDMVFSETHLSWGPQTIGGYFYTRLLWNPDLDLDKELQDFCNNYYGPAAKPMLQYHRLLEEASLKGKPWFFLGSRIGYLFTDDKLMAQLTQLMNQAQRLTKNKAPYQRRIHGEWAGYEVARRFNIAMKHKRENRPQRALAEWDAIGEFLKTENVKNNEEIWDIGKVYNSWRTQSIAYGMEALRAQMKLVSEMPGSKFLGILDEDWKFKTDANREGVEKGYTRLDFNDTAWHDISASNDWTSQGHAFHGTAWYRKRINFKTIDEDKKYVLSFGAVDGDTLVYFNGKKVAENWLGPDYAGYNRPFTADITPHLQEGDNIITVQVTKEFALAGITKGVSLLQLNE